MIGFPELLMTAVMLIGPLLALALLYIVVRFAIRDALLDVDRVRARRASPVTDPDPRP